MVEFKCICIVSIVLVLCVAVGCTPLPEAQTLKFREDGTFKVLFLADLHFGWSDDLDFGAYRQSSKATLNFGDKEKR